MYTSKDMYHIASAMAVKQGPTVLNVGGRMTAAYALSRQQIEDLYEDNHYSLMRSTWRRSVNNWERYGALVPKEVMKPEHTGTWSVIFTAITKDDLLALRMFAENQDSYYLPEVAGGIA